MWPTPQDYNEAVQNPRSSFDDAELQHCLPEVNALGLPRAISGSFASVYHLRSATKHFAVRCFLRNVPDQSERYKRISECLAQAELPYTVPFEYLSKGVNVSGQWFPVLKMEWVAGTPLIEWIQEKAGNPHAIDLLLENFLKMVAELRRHGIAHGDLQHGNILVINDQLKLVDYDGTFVPQLEAFCSTELGHRHYQHPRRNSTHFGAYLDNFAAWSIYTSLYCLSKDGRLWSRLGSGDECLLFRQDDYENPSKSIAFRYLEHHDSRVIREASRTLRALIPISPEAIPPLGEPIAEREHLPDLEKPQTWFPSFAWDGSPMQAEPENLRVAYQTTLAFAEGSSRTRIIADEGEQEETALPPWYRDPQTELATQQVMPPEYYQLPVRPRRTVLPAALSLPPPKPKSFWDKYQAPILAMGVPLALVIMFNTVWEKPVFVPDYAVEEMRPLAATAPGGRYELGRKEFREKQYQKALASFTIALKDASLKDKKFCLYQIGRCHAALESYKSAIVNFDSASSAFERDHVFVPALATERGLAMMSLKLYRQAQASFKEQINRCKTYKLPANLSKSAYAGLRTIALISLTSGNSEGFSDYKDFAVETEASWDAIFADLRDAALKLERDRKYQLALSAWEHALDAQYWSFSELQEDELRSRKIQILQAMSKNRANAGDFQAARVIEAEIKSVIEPELPIGKVKATKPVQSAPQPTQPMRINPVPRMSTDASAVDKQYEELIKKSPYR